MLEFNHIKNIFVQDVPETPDELIVAEMNYIGQQLEAITGKTIKIIVSDWPDNTYIQLFKNYHPPNGAKYGEGHSGIIGITINTTNEQSMTAEGYYSYQTNLKTDNSELDTSNNIVSLTSGITEFSSEIDNFLNELYKIYIPKILDKNEQEHWFEYLEYREELQKQLRWEAAKNDLV